MQKKRAGTRTRPRVPGCILFLSQLACMVLNRWKHAQDELLTPSELRDTPFSYRSPRFWYPNGTQILIWEPRLWFFWVKIFHFRKNRKCFNCFSKFTLIPSKLVRNSSKRTETVLKPSKLASGWWWWGSGGMAKLSKIMIFFDFPISVTI